MCNGSPRCEPRRFSNFLDQHSSMMISFPDFDRRAVGARLRSLICGQPNSSVGDTAARLGVSEAALNAAIDESSPHPTPVVVAAVVRALGVDPGWLLTGVYDAAMHRHSLEDEADVGSNLASRLTLPEPRLDPDHLTP